MSQRTDDALATAFEKELKKLFATLVMEIASGQSPDDAHLHFEQGCRLLRAAHARALAALSSIDK